MYCYRCNGTVDMQKQVCPKCGADLHMFKKIVSASNRYYNYGLAKARARDLTGARDALRTSISLYKRNIPARNLLGLVYYAMGESAEGLKQWMLSKSFAEGNNLADRYIGLMRRNMHDLDSEGNGIRKFNQALTYANSDARDMAVIQLKKVISVHKNMTKAYNLLALLYMEAGRPVLARKVLKRCLAIDCGNTQALAYLKEMDEMEADNEGGRSLGTVGEEDREQLVIPVRFRDFGSYLSNSVYVLLGVALGILISWFVIVPGRVKEESDKNANHIQSLSEQINNLQQSLDVLETHEEPIGTIAPTEEETVSESSKGPVAEESFFDLSGTVSWQKNQEMINRLVLQWTQTFDYTETGRLFRLTDPEKLSKVNEQHYRDLVSILLSQDAYTKIHEKADNLEYKEQYEKAAMTFDTLIYLHPEDVTVRRLAGICYERAGLSEKAANRYWQAAVLFPETEEGIECKEKYLSMTGKTELPDLPDEDTIAKETRALTTKEFLDAIKSVDQ